MVVTPPALHEPTWFACLKKLDHQDKGEEYGEYVESLSEPDHNNREAKQYADACRDVVTKYCPDSRCKIALVDLWQAGRLPLSGNEDLFWDGVHFTELASKIVFQAILDVIKEKFPELHLEVDNNTGRIVSATMQQLALPWHNCAY